MRRVIKKASVRSEERERGKKKARRKNNKKEREKGNKEKDGNTSARVMKKET